jgi:RHS repeat-associated protein
VRSSAFAVNVLHEYPIRGRDPRPTVATLGQYFDKETNLHYNYFRDYDSGIGRYVQSDPIGLRGGLNTFVYVNDPLTQIDPEGLMGRAPGRGPAPSTPASPAPFLTSGSCDGRWVRVNWTRDPGSALTLDCTCYWSCYSCPPIGDVFPVPNLGQYLTKGKILFTGKRGKDFNPEIGDECECPKPGEEKGCGPC